MTLSRPTAGAAATRMLIVAALAAALPACSRSGFFATTEIATQDRDDATAPVLESIPPQVVAEGAQLQLQMVARDPEPTPLVYACSRHCPDNLVVEAATGVVLFTPGYDQSGLFGDIGLTVSDGANVAEQSLTITVVNVPHFRGWLGRRSSGEPSGGWVSGGSAIAGDGDGMLSAPTGVCLDASGRIYVADTDNHRIQRFTATGAAAGWLGRRASASAASSGFELGDRGVEGVLAGEFRNPAGCSVLQDGLLYVADDRNHRVQVFDPDGLFVREIGEPGIGDGQLTRPVSVAGDSAGFLYVAEGWGGRVSRFTVGGEFAGWIGGVYESRVASGWVMGGSATLSDVEGAFRRPEGVAVDASGMIYVTDAYNHRLQRFSAEGLASGWLGANGGHPTQQWTTGGSATPSSADGGFNEPRGLALGPADTLFVVDAGNRRVQELELTGAHLRTLAAPGSANGELVDPVGIAVDHAGVVYVGDRCRVARYDTTGELTGWIGADASGPVDRWVTTGSARCSSDPGGFNSIYGLALDEAASRLVVADYENNRLQVFAADTGSFLGEISIGGPTYVTVDSSGRIYAGSARDGRVIVVARDLSLAGSFGSLGTGDGQFSQPKGIAEHGEYLYVVDGNWLPISNRLQRWTSALQFSGWIGKRAPTQTTAGWHIGDRPEPGIAPGMLGHPGAIAVDEPNDLLLVPDHYVQAILRFRLSTGEYLDRLDIAASLPRAVALDSAGRVVVGARDELDVMLPDGVAVYGSAGNGDAQLAGIMGVARDGDDLITVDAGNHRLELW